MVLMPQASMTWPMRSIWPLISRGVSFRPPLYSLYSVLRWVDSSETSNATAMWVGCCSLMRLISIEVKPWMALVCWPLEVENLSAGSAKKARKAIEWPSRTSSRGWLVMGTTGASVAETDPPAAGAALVTAGFGASAGRCPAAPSSMAWDGKGAGLVVSLTGATMPVEGNTQVAGILHGGAHVVLAETLGYFASGMHAGPGRHAVGIEVNAT